ncbi:MAG: ATP-binding protein [Gemmatimonadota bacterium]
MRSLSFDTFFGHTPGVLHLSTQLMNGLPTLRRELITAFALVFAGALLVALIGFVLLIPVFASPIQAFVYLAVLVTCDVVVFAVFGRLMVQRRILSPIAEMVRGAETIAHDDLEHRLPAAETSELNRLAEAINRMAERLIADKALLAENIRSLDETNQLLTEARDAMVRTEKLASAGRLAAGIAHEVGNPLGAIIGYLGLVGRHAEGRQKELIANAEREAHRIDRIVRGLLDYSRPHEPRARALDVNTVVRDTMDLVHTQGRFLEIELNVDLSEPLPPVIGDPYQLQQVLVNLFVNAADALESAGTKPARVSVRTRLREAQQKLHVRARRKDDPPSVNYSHRRRLWAAPAHNDPAPVGQPVVEILITDNGPGIPPEMLTQIFEPFVTTKEPGKGTGLGLAVCARLVEGMGGVIRAENLNGQGAQFNIVLPLADSEPQTTVA